MLLTTSILPITTRLALHLLMIHTVHVSTNYTYLQWRKSTAQLERAMKRSRMSPTSDLSMLLAAPHLQGSTHNVNK